MADVGIRSRTRSALAVKTARGEYTGGKVPYGYRLAEDGEHLETVEQEQAIIAEARALRAEGRVLRDVANTLAGRGMTNRAGAPFGPAAVAAMVAT